MALIQHNIDEWIRENQKYFLPPVCNKMMHDGQLKVFYVGGPNVRKDYHIELGEEFFYMRNGDMDLLIMEKGVPKVVPIKQGEVFLLPGKIPHSPQRYENTVGLVVERQRTAEEMDCLRYYTKDASQILYERWFHCVDLGAQLKPLIEDFFESDEYRTGNPSPNSRLTVASYEPDELRTVGDPFSLEDWLKRNQQVIDHMGKLSLFGGSYRSQIIVYGPGEDETIHEDEDTLLWQLRGSSTVELKDEPTRAVGANDMIIVRRGRQFKIRRSEGARVMQIVMGNFESSKEIR